MTTTRWFPALLALAAVLALAAACAGGGDGAATRYHCPMHPTYTSDRPGDCPICGMRLVPMEEAPPPAAPAQLYECPMHPEVTSRNPEDRCPQCGMKIDQPVPEPAGGAPAAAPGAPAGYAPLELHADAVQLAGVQTAPAVAGSIGRAVRAVGTIAPDERRVRHVHTKIDGWIEKLYVNFTGQAVRQGQPILSLYSPDILAGQQEFLRARAAAERFSASALPEVREGAEDLLHAARRRLELLDVPPAFIEQLERGGEARRAVTLLSPVSGFVTAKDTFEGQKVEPGMELYTVTDLSRVWVEADIYEFEAAAIGVGQPARITSPYDAALDLAGQVAYVYPYLQPDTRTLKVRFEFPNPRLDLKPGMYVNVEMTLEPRAGLTIPDSAVIDSGVRQVVFVDRGGGRFEPREVRLDARANGRALVLSGLAAGENVAVRANFLLDSESRLRAALAGGGPAGAHQH
ncbi:MAG: efflux RND transporter periplasmic adaptor subunit [Acidobacteria bacterium]|nr:efflux RND transporter periplasmic adaptor subunit [Acidobacteriota bacterium]